MGQDDVGTRLRSNSPSHAAHSNYTSVHVARGSSSYKKEWCGWRGWPLEPLEPERSANAAGVGTFTVWEVEWDWDIGLGDWVGVSVVTSEFLTTPEKRRHKRRYTHILHGCFSLKAVDFSVASKKNELHLFPTTSVFPPFAPERCISYLKR